MKRIAAAFWLAGLLVACPQGPGAGIAVDGTVLVNDRPTAGVDVLLDAGGRTTRLVSGDGGAFHAEGVAPPYRLTVASRAWQSVLVLDGLSRPDPTARLRSDLSDPLPPSRSTPRALRPLAGGLTFNLTATGGERDGNPVTFYLSCSDYTYRTASGTLSGGSAAASVTSNCLAASGNVALTAFEVGTVAGRSRVLRFGRSAPLPVPASGPVPVNVLMTVPAAWTAVDVTVAFPAGAEHPTTVLGDSRDDWRFHFFDCPGGSCRLDLPADRVNYARAYAGSGGSFSTDRAAISGPSQSVALVLPDFLHLDSPASGAVVEPGAVLAWRGPDALTAAIVYGLGYRFEAYTSGKSVTLPDLGAVGLPWAKGASLMASVVALPRGSLDALTDADGGYPTWDANTQETVDFATAP